MWTFDVFDTCLVRRHAVPTDVFLTIADRLERQLKAVLGTDYAEVFLEIRTSAEALALKRAETEETSLEAIWQEVKQILPDIDTQKGMSTELEVEAETLTAVPSTLNIVSEARRKFGKVIFISDSYLPSDFIEAQLRAHGFLCDNDCCFVSSTYLKTKRSGSLYQEVVHALGVPSKDITHHGDNYQSDVHVARACGLNAVHLTDALLNSREREIGQQVMHLCQSKTSKIIGAMRIGRLNVSSTSNEAAKSLVSNFIGPVLWIFADWILTRASRDGIKRIYFFSRDCHGLYEMASALSKQRGLEIDCRYLRVSRQALLLPAVTEISQEGMPWLRRSWERGRIRDLAGKLDTDVTAIVATMAAEIPSFNEDSCLTTEEHWNIFWKALSAPQISEKLFAKISERRKNALAYFEQEGLFENKEIAIVDLGWHQSCQNALANILRSCDPSIVVSGYYLGLVGGRSSYIKGSLGQAMYHAPPYDRKSSFDKAVVFSRAGLLEHVLNCAPHGTAHHYETDHKTGKKLVKCLDVCEKEIIAKTILFKELSRFANEQCGPLGLSEYEAREFLSAIIASATQRPDQKWGEILSMTEVADDQNNGDRSCMTKPRSARIFFRDLVLLRDLKRVGLSQLGIWPELSLVMTPRGILLGYKAAGVIVDTLRFIRKYLFLINKSRM